MQNGTEKELEFFERQKNLLASLAKIRTIRVLPPGEVPPAAATALVGKLEIHIPLEGLIDIDAEKARLEKELTKLRKDFDKADTKLNNPRFIDKAPIEVIEKETARRQKSKEAIQKLSAKLKLLPD